MRGRLRFADLSRSVSIMATSETPPLRGLVGRSILLVDDEHDILSALGEVLRREFGGVTVHTADSGPGALDVLARHPPDVILSDYRMPQMNGIEFLQRARQVAPSASQMLITAYPDLQVAVDAIDKAGIEGFFVKPLNLLQLLDTVAATLHERVARGLRARAAAASYPMGRAPLDPGRQSPPVPNESP